VLLYRFNRTLVNILLTVAIANESYDTMIKSNCKYNKYYKSQTKLMVQKSRYCISFDSLKSWRIQWFGNMPIVICSSSVMENYFENFILPSASRLFSHILSKARVNISTFRFIGWSKSSKRNQTKKNFHLTQSTHVTAWKMPYLRDIVLIQTQLLLQHCVRFGWTRFQLEICA